MSPLTILSPVPRSVVTERPLAARPVTIGGTRVGLLDNRKANAGALLEVVGRELTARHPDIELVSEHKSAPAPAPDAVHARLRTCDAVVLAIAD